MGCQLLLFSDAERGLVEHVLRLGTPQTIPFMATYTPEQIAEFAPDMTSMKAARDLAKPEKWQQLLADAQGISGAHQGSGTEPYQAHIVFDGPNFACSCPSRKQPCKHALGLLLLHTQQPNVFAEGSSQPDSELGARGEDSNGETLVSAPGSLFGPPLTAGGGGMTSAALPPDWAAKLGSEFEQSYFGKLRDFVLDERQTHTVYPPATDVFNAFKHTPYASAKVLILGQDPYHGPRQAHGLAFSVQPKITTPPSLQNIFQELRDELGCRVPNNGYLVPWAEQGVMLLNAVLTVRRSEPNSHKSKGWEKFTDATIRALNDKPDRVVFVLWGAYARKKKALIDESRHVVVESAHPSPLSAHTGFFGSKPFSQINAALREAGKTEIDWQIPNL